MGAQFFWWHKLRATSATCCYFYHDTTGKIKFWWAQRPKELTGGDGYMYRFKQNAVLWIFLNASDIECGETPPAAVVNRWHLAFLVSVVCKLAQELCSTKTLKGIRAKVERERSGSLGSFIHLQAFFLSLGKSYIASIAALRLKITTKATQCVSVKSQRL